MNAAYREVGSYRAAAKLCGTTPKAVRRAVAAAEAEAAGPAPAVAHYDTVADIVAERVAKTNGLTSAKRLLPTARAAGYDGRRAVYVLESFYEAPRHRVAEAVRSLIAFDPVICVDPPLLLRPAEVYETYRIDFADAYLLACAESTGVGEIASFDRSLDCVPSIERTESPPAT